MKRITQRVFLPFLTLALLVSALLFSVSCNDGNDGGNTDTDIDDNSIYATAHCTDVMGNTYDLPIIGRAIDMSGMVKLSDPLAGFMGFYMKSGTQVADSNGVLLPSFRYKGKELNLDARYRGSTVRFVYDYEHTPYHNKNKRPDYFSSEYNVFDSISWFSQEERSMQYIVNGWGVKAWYNDGRLVAIGDTPTEGHDEVLSSAYTFVYNNELDCYVAYLYAGEVPDYYNDSGTEKTDIFLDYGDGTPVPYTHGDTLGKYYRESGRMMVYSFRDSGGAVYKSGDVLTVAGTYTAVWSSEYRYVSLHLGSMVRQVLLYSEDRRLSLASWSSSDFDSSSLCTEITAWYDNPRMTGRRYDYASYSDGVTDFWGFDSGSSVRIRYNTLISGAEKIEDAYLSDRERSLYLYYPSDVGGRRFIGWTENPGDIVCVNRKLYRDEMYSPEKTFYARWSNEDGSVTMEIDGYGQVTVTPDGSRLLYLLMRTIDIPEGKRLVALRSAANGKDYAVDESYSTFQLEQISMSRLTPVYEDETATESLGEAYIAIVPESSEYGYSGTGRRREESV